MADVLRPADSSREDSVSATTGSAQPPSAQRRWHLPLLILLYLAMYGRALTFGFVWDDSANSSQSALLRGPLSQVLRKGEHARSEPATERMPKDLVPMHESYRPVSVTSHWLDVRLFGDRAWPMHAHNLLLGLLSIVLVSAVGRALALGLWLPCLWALHPLHVEVFAYVSARSDLLAAIFSLLALLSALRSADARGPRPRWTWALAAACFQLSSLFAKEATIALPMAVMALALARGKLRASAASTSTLLAVTVAYFPLRKLLMQSASLPMAQGKALVHAVVDLPGVALAHVVSFVAPFSLSPDRQLWPPMVPLGWLAMALLVLGFALAFLRVRPGRADLGLAAGAVAAFGLLLLPAALAVRSIGAFSDRYVFFPFLFLAVGCVVAARATARLMTHVPRVLWMGPLYVWCALLLVVTWLQIGVWKSDETLARHAAAMDPDNSAAIYRLSTVATSAGDFAKALPLLERAVLLNPTNQRALGNLSVVYLNLGRVADAKSVLRQLAPLASATDRRFWYNLASVHVAEGRRDKACSALAHALEIDPGYELALSLHHRTCATGPAQPGR
jgi:protein O-mannosyl-transferase